LRKAPIKSWVNKTTMMVAVIPKAILEVNGQGSAVLLATPIPPMAMALMLANDDLVAIMAASPLSDP
jgi:hypothetical protein